MSRIIKRIQSDVIRKLSSERSQQFYVQGIPLSQTPDDVHAHQRPEGSSVGSTKAESLDGNQHIRSSKVNELNSISPNERRVLLYLCSLRIPIAPQKEIVYEMKITSGSVLNRIQKRLVTLGLIRLHRLQSGKNFIVVWESTERAFALLSLNPASHHSIGGNLHSYISLNVMDRLLGEGWHVAQEFTLNDGSLIDLVARKDDQLFCFEIGLPPLEKEIGNSLKCLTSELKPTGIVHLVQNSKYRNALECHLKANESLSSSLGSLVKVRLAYEYMHLQPARAP